MIPPRRARRSVPGLATWWVGLVSIAALAAFASLPDADPAKRRTVYPSRFPDGAGRALAERSCLTCHSAPLTTQQHKDSTGWEKTLRTMESWGVKLSAAERDTLFSYLRAKFGVIRK